MKIRKTPYAYRHPQDTPADGANDTPAAAPATRKTGASTHAPAPIQAPDALRRSTEPSALQRSPEPKVTIQLAFAPPEAGACELFDQLVGAGVATEVATLRVGRWAIDRAVGGDPNQLEGSYTQHLGRSETGLVTTTRSVPTAFYRSAKRALDPLNVLSGRAFGRLLADSAMRAWLARGKT